jgi:hypothetical protein
MVWTIFFLDIHFDVIGFVVSQRDGASGKLKNHRIAQGRTPLEPKGGAGKDSHIPDSSAQLPIGPDRRDFSGLPVFYRTQTASHRFLLGSG